jgi:antitoxin MazE
MARATGEKEERDIAIRRLSARVRANAAAGEIIAESRHHSLGDITIRELIEDGRRNFDPPNC